MVKKRLRGGKTIIKSHKNRRKNSQKFQQGGVYQFILSRKQTALSLPVFMVHHPMSTIQTKCELNASLALKELAGKKRKPNRKESSPIETRMLFKKEPTRLGP